MGIKIDSWNEVGTKYDIHSAMSNKMLIFKAGIDFSSSRRALQYLFNSREREYTRFFLNSPYPPNWFSHKESTPS